MYVSREVFCAPLVSLHRAVTARCYQTIALSMIEKSPMGWILYEESMYCPPAPTFGAGNDKGAQFATHIGLGLAMEDKLFRKDAMAAPSPADAERALSASRRAFRHVLASWASDVLVLRKSGHLSMAFRSRRDDSSDWSKAA